MGAVTITAEPPGAPPQNTNSVSSGLSMREDAIRAKMDTVIGRSLRGMIRNAVWALKSNCRRQKFTPDTSRS
jgi:hypothetical protein